MFKVGSQDVTASEIKKTWEGLFPPGAAPDFATTKPDVRDRVLRGVMTERLLFQESLKQGVDKSDTYLRELEDLKRKIAVRHYLEMKTADAVSEQDLKTEYDSLAATLQNTKEARARHILLQTEKEAAELRKKIEEGKSFEDAAKEFSKDPGSARQGGDLGYFTKDKMVKEFADAAFALKKGDISQPVRSPFGYHLIKLEDLRPATVPTFNDAKDQLKAKLQEKKLNDFIRGLVRQTEVKLYDPKGKELPFEKDVSEAKKP
jgi:peptidyl-prolyl cis-trans isomerase C